MWVPFPCWLCRLWYDFPDFVDVLPDSEEAEEGSVWAERLEPVVLISGGADIGTIRKRAEVREVQQVWCLYDGVHPTPTYGVARQFPCGCRMSGDIHVMYSWAEAIAQVVEADAEAKLFWSFLQGRDELGAAKVPAAKLAERALKGSQAAASELAAVLRSISHSEAERIGRVKVEVLTFGGSEEG